MDPGKPSIIRAGGFSGWNRVTPGPAGTGGDLQADQGE
jgi:hypothetical protein